MGSMLLPNAERPRLMVQVIEEKAQWQGNETFMRYPTPDWQEEGFRTITWSQFADAVNKMAYWLDNQLGKSRDQDTIAYLGPSDPRYSIMIPAAIKTSRKLFIPDGRVTSEGLDSLVRSAECSIWLHAEGSKYRAGLGENTGLRFLNVPTIAWMLDSEEYKPYPYLKTFEEARFDQVLVIHTSGTTGFPKPIYHTNGFYSAWSSCLHLSQKYWPKGTSFDAWVGKMILTACPPQWLGGLHSYIFGPIFMNISTTIAPPGVVGLPPDIFKSVLKHNKIDGIHCPPQVVHELYKEKSTKSLLESLEFIIFLGATLDRDIGDDLCRHTRVIPLIGSTENGPQVDLPPVDRELWYTHAYAPENGNRMIHVPDSSIAGGGSEGLYELALERAADGQPNVHQCAFWNPMHRDISIIHTNELYTPLKDKDGSTRWNFVTRKDDLTKLSWLAKFHAQDLEGKFLRHPDVRNVFVGGQGRPTPFVIIEPNGAVRDFDQASSLILKLYEEVIKKGNEECVTEIGIPKHTIILTKPGKPLKRNAKSGINRRAAEEDYAGEIEEAYHILAKLAD
ncbi:acetyl-CoA synthetase-like protein [Aaosphaeria arxii CBS 175.79]|uniref:Acetyl-CoA synthetase-like protein n=1 Tax=Aaosphaeria arxii CBS 175.79 TaxID=1450172 RepID=A0A6A5XV54_9PLEO|nr:acetyl-CoA synthetase-like protein [Aaosphaeria arxii CBS 175.79]KAF2016134.1 acetyl-CoA synthetase-like protein [Aaosphaeria arxii CBS 175.79]